ncbi:hypothetical protein [Schaalia hyovaginalis]|uniref:Uncharacterized protein n=1 Tax=Schaalia hyovaginalis TaxID=29316 RepID=A0A923E0Z4_9ACTO|nr:hypothetical protein [Schaalia hyovaginalis]MBB6333943.1 hypothetical protein [Schaalia hyovaginalis]
MMDDRGVVVSISGTTVLRPGMGRFPMYTSHATVDNGELVAYLTGLNNDGGGFPSTRLAIGESIVDSTAGTFTLLDVTPGSGGGLPGSGGTAAFRFVPKRGFELSEELASSRP